MNYHRTFILCIVMLACLVSTAATQDFQVRIDTTINTKQGTSTEISIRLDSISNVFQEISMINFIIQFDPSALSLQSIKPGELYVACEWEYFTYGYAYNANCGDLPCPSGAVRIASILDVPLGNGHNPTCYGGISGELFKLMFIVSHERRFAGTFSPVQFVWYNCGTNAFSSLSGDSMYISSSVFESGVDIANDSTGWPTITGAQNECDNTPGSPISVIRNINFINGGVDIACPDTYDVRLGDIDINRVANEIADNKLFRSYFVEGTKVFTLHVNSQAGATDLNQDGIILTLEDFVFQTRIIHDDKVPGIWYGLDRKIRLLLDNEMKTLTQLTDTTLGAMLITFNSESVVPTLLSSGMDLHYSSGNGVTKVLISSVDSANGFGNGDIISWTGAGYPSEIKAVMWAGLGITVEMALPTDVVDDRPLTPGSPLLHQNYPNPFNNSTVISFELARSSNVTIDVLDLLGRTVWNSNGRYSPGVHSIDWPGLDKSGNEVASGMYFYRLTSDDFTETRKMLLVK